MHPRGALVLLVKAELALKARREIADYIGAGKDDRARIRVSSRHDVEWHDVEIVWS